ncbi:MAG: YncE family protein, partial [Syntrophothermus sp.]
MKKSFLIKAAAILWMLLLQAGGLTAQNSATKEAPHSGYKVTGAIDIGGEGRWDYCIVDTINHQLFVSHGNRIHAVDLKNNTIKGEITGLNGVHGIALAYEFNKGYISNGRSDTVTVFNLKTLQVTGKIRVTGSNPDAIIYDPYSKKVFTFNGRSSNATAIDAATDKIAGTLALDGKPEFSVSDLNGRMYVNIEDKSIIEEFDPKALKVTNKFSIAPCREPSGLAIDLKNKKLFTVGSNKQMSILDIKTGKVVASLPIGGGVDGCTYDPATHLVFSSNGEGTLTVIRQYSPERYKVLDNIPTAKGLRTLALDQMTHKVYLIGM